MIDMRHCRLRVIILNYNRAQSTCLCAESVLLQVYSPIDVVVVDNHSSDSEVEILEKALPPQVNLVKCDRNGGYAAGNNVGARLNSLPCPDYVMIINNDAILSDPYTCEKLVRALERDEERVACSPLVNTSSAKLPPEQQIQVRRVPQFWTVVVASSWWLRRFPGLSLMADRYVYQDLRPYRLDQEYDCESINGSCFVIRNDFLKRIGYLDQGTFLYAEEIILGKQIKDWSRTACLVTSAIVRHDQGSTSGHRAGHIRLNTSIEMAKSEIYYCRKYLHSSPFHICLLVAVRITDIITKLTYQSAGELLIKGRRTWK
jgi:GT2 family glycosyltransferase